MERVVFWNLLADILNAIFMIQSGLPDIGHYLRLHLNHEAETPQFADC